MNPGIKIRFHMGCGEPLQGRWRVGRAADNRAGSSRSMKDTAARGKQGAESREAKCKS